MEIDEEGEVRLTYYPEELIPVAKYLGLQGRFKKMSAARISMFQAFVEERMIKLGYSEESDRSKRDLAGPSYSAV